MIKEVLDYLKHARSCGFATKSLRTSLCFWLGFSFFLSLSKSLLDVLLSAPFRSINNSLEQKGFESIGHSGMHRAKHDKDLSFM